MVQSSPHLEHENVKAQSYWRICTRPEWSLFWSLVTIEANSWWWRTDSQHSGELFKWSLECESSKPFVFLNRSCILSRWLSGEFEPVQILLHNFCLCNMIFFNIREHWNLIYVNLTVKWFFFFDYQLLINVLYYNSCINILLLSLSSVYCLLVWALLTL